MVVLDKDVHKKVNNFFKALNNLKEIVGKEPPFDPITEAGMVDSEDLWHDALKARNNVVHSYSDEVALEIIKMAQVERDGVILYETG